MEVERETFRDVTGKIDWWNMYNIETCERIRDFRYKFGFANLIS